MPSHTWNEVGRWGDSVRANLEAWHSDLKAAIGEGFAIYPEHNLHMLLYAASMDGQGAIAMQAGKDYAKLTGDTFYQVLTLVRFGRFDEVLEVTKRPEGRDDRRGCGTSRRATRSCKQRRRRLRARSTSAACRRRPRRRRPSSACTRGEESARRRRPASSKARSCGRKATSTARSRRSKGAPRLEDALSYDEPEPLPFAARHWLGAALLEAKRSADAEKVYRDELDDHPHNGWSLLGLQQALEAQGKTDAAVDKDFEKSWARSDHWIRSSRF